MQKPPKLVDRTALERNRARAGRDLALFLHEHVADMLQERLEEINKSFHAPLAIAPFPDRDGALLNIPAQPDRDDLGLAERSHDLILHFLSLHWANDPVGQLIQARRALRPDGLFLCTVFGGETLRELREALSRAESEVTGGLSPRIAPMGEIRDYGALLQRAGFALPVADNITLTVEYEDVYHLMRDLRAMGETNALAQRLRKFTPRAVFDKATEYYASAYRQDSGRVRASFDILFLTGWAPDPSQQQPLRPGSAQTSLADALGKPKE